MKSIFTSEQIKNCSLLKKNWTTILSVIMLVPLLFMAGQTFGQAGDLSQIRNGDGKVKNSVLDTCGSCWVNGNAGASNAHYAEGMSIAYRSLVTGLTPGVCYEYELGYDTYHGAMAIDYLTHFQRLYPHGPLGHPAEVVNPLAMISGSTAYNMAVIPNGVKDFDIPAPAASGITSGAFNKDGSPRNVSQQARTSFLALPVAERKMTIYNGEILAINYGSQATIVIGGADAESRILVRFRADDDSVVLAWGGHIASRLDWGYTKDSKGKLTPLSAAGISGSPYHMRQKSMFVVNCSTGAKISPVTGIGNQDRSLSAAAVVPPPECPTVTSKTQCFDNQTFAFAVDVPLAGVTYTWSFATNTANATFLNDANTGNSVTVVANTGPDVQGVDNGGSFTLNIVASQNGVTQDCNGVASGTVVDVDVDAEDADNTLQINLNNSTTASLGIQSITPGTTANYTFAWTLISKPSGGNSSFTNGTSASATFNVLSPYAAGDYVVRVTATQSAAPGCSSTSDVTIVVGGGVGCKVEGPSPVCPGSQDNVYFYDANNSGNYEPLIDVIPSDFNAQWSFDGTHPSAEFDGSTTGATVKVDVAALGTSCATSYTVKLTLTAKAPGVTTSSCTKTVSVQDTEPPVITFCPADKLLECSDPAASILPENTGDLTFTDNCSASKRYDDITSINCNITVIKRTWTVTDLCGNAATCVQIITVKDTQGPSITCLSDGNATITDGCSAAADIVKYFKDVNGVRKWTAIDKAGNVSTKDCPLPAPPGFRQSNTTTSATTDAVTEQRTVQVNGTVQEAVKASTIEVSALKITAEPNPFADKVNFRFTSPVSGRAKLEILNAVGQKIGVAYEGMVNAGTSYTIPYYTRGVRTGTLIYNLRVNDKSVNGKLIQLK
jgi:hypothetical protein